MRAPPSGVPLRNLCEWDQGKIQDRVTIRGLRREIALLMENDPRQHKVPRTLLIVFVEDNTDVRETVAELLRDWGHTVHEAEDGPSGWDTIMLVKPDVALVDLGLPGFDGLELARRVRRSPALKGLRLVALTGFGQASDRVRSRDAGFDVHLVKPAQPATLMAALTAVTEMHEPPGGPVS
jgi:CheY-like chemotaxis protein